MDALAVLAMILTVGVGFLMLKPKKNDEKINELDKEKAKEMGRLEEVKEQGAALKEQVAKEQANLSEEGKKSFWDDYAKKND